MLNCCKWLQISRNCFQVRTDLSEGRRKIDWGAPGRARRGRASETTVPLKWVAVWVQIGTANGAKSVIPHLTQSQDKREIASAIEPFAQLDFQFTVDPNGA